MNGTIENLQQAQQQLEADFRQRMAALVKAQEQAEKAIAKNATLEVAKQEEAEAAKAKAEATDALNLSMIPVLDELKAVTDEVSKMRSEVARCHQRLVQMTKLQRGLYTRLSAAAREIGIAAGANRGAFRNENEMQQWVASQIRCLFPFGMIAVGETDLPTKFKQRDLYYFAGFGNHEQQTMIMEALRHAR